MTDGDLTLTSTDFAEGERIPQEHAYRPEGENRAPGLSWTGVPDGTKELALIVDDPDAPREDPWVHWVVYKIPLSATGVPGDAVEGENDFGAHGWGGPLPPKGHGTHHYHFKLYALDAEIGLGPGATKVELLEAMEGHVLAEAELVGTYSR
jgi:Raf kinase inhibitor-like YbhB/YbcL family protein